MTGDRVIQVCAALIIGDQRLLVAKRKPGLQQGGLWEFPGGKQHPGESPQQCLVRELREELGIEVSVGDLFTSTTHAYPDYTISLSAYWATWDTGTALQAFDNSRFTDHSEVRWVNDQELASLYRDPPPRGADAWVPSLSPADIPIAEKLLASTVYKGGYHPGGIP